MRNILLVSHYSGTPGGPTDKFYDYLIKKKYRVFTIKHPLYPQKKDLKSEIGNGKWKIHFKIPPFLQYFTESLYTLFFGFNILKENLNHFNLAICFDSLSFTHIYLLKYFLGIKKIVFYNIDFSKKRFSNRLINFIYHQTNRFAYSYCDYCFSLFTTFIDHIDPNHKNSNNTFLVKSTTDLSLINKKVKLYKNSIVYAGSIEYGSNDFDPLLEALTRLKNAGFKFKFDIFGPIKPDSKLKSTVIKLRLDKFIFFKGVIDNKILTEQILPQYQIGLAPYTTRSTKNTPDHTFLGTDLTAKLVDYIAAGLPVITTRLNPGFEQVNKYNFGILVDSSNDWYIAIKKLLLDRKTYNLMKNNAFKYSKVYDIEMILTPILKRVLSN